MSPASIGGGYRFGFQAVSISSASLKRAKVWIADIIIKNKQIKFAQLN